MAFIQHIRCHGLHQVSKEAADFAQAVQDAMQIVLSMGKKDEPIWLEGLKHVHVFRSKCSLFMLARMENKMEVIEHVSDKLLQPSVDLRHAQATLARFAANALDGKTPAVNAKLKAEWALIEQQSKDATEVIRKMEEHLFTWALETFQAKQELQEKSMKPGGGADFMVFLVQAPKWEAIRQNMFSAAEQANRSHKQ